ncbi:Deoxynucleotidyltransferase terminal-interacting protein [Ooceraea biroi]|uniref:Deoxynucleotidyltransferase terminal-interacting protein n=1 Tax=Ooceraea biroi TaxID=2015173 RepID=A0A026WLB1_OOCBI|nr:Deoxynucleotidyltransferase terminal-interacting protein [Ooceraea biroi]
MEIRDQLQSEDDDTDDDVKIKCNDKIKPYVAFGITEKKKPKKKKKVVSSNDFDLEQFEADMGWKSSKATYKPMEELTNLRKEVNPLDKILEKSVIKPGFEQLHVVPPYELSKHQLELRKQRQRKKMGAGAGWCNLRTPHVTPEIRRDLEVLQMRSALDPKRFYKKNDLQTLPKHFHVGKVVDSPMDFYSSRLTKKERKRTIVDELMADAQFTKFNKRKYKDIIDEKKKKTHYKAHQHAKRLKGKRK